jgi:hypothetical protein
VGGEVQASFEGLRQFAGLCGDQAGYVSAVRDHVAVQCGQTGAFTGFMYFFRDAYEDAHRQVLAELAKATQGARDASAAFAGVLAEYQAAERRTSETLGKLQVRMDEATPYAAPAGDDGFGVPRPVKYSGGVMTAGNIVSESHSDYLHRLGELPEPDPLAPDPKLRGLASDGVSFVSDFSDTISAGTSMREARVDEDRYAGFEREHAEEDDR